MDEGTLLKIAFGAYAGQYLAWPRHGSPDSGLVVSKNGPLSRSYKWFDLVVVTSYKVELPKFRRGWWIQNYKRPEYITGGCCLRWYIPFEHPKHGDYENFELKKEKLDETVETNILIGQTHGFLYEIPWT